ncbi:hypothetical protein A1O3_06971 [Capronia epimyces CBS 606.96]|uniref:AB hydrolase-1 domain-containing protein n=1 Tax=Capronia epimyces CBS 606.96 TaxID=1182542 RepID=W9XJI9_9EURO|nr:uncharacterized protein A1O3_06971 [Capronia epimyces CBS 606.96]EXJ80687.1 hypothetical protein A1O3_06971 [Capronia epimyces CBS 606.96]
MVASISPSHIGPGPGVVKGAYVDTAEGQLHYYYTLPSTTFGSSSGSDSDSDGSPHPPILLLHMSASSSRCFHSMMVRLAALGYRCYAPDMPGFGSSFDPSSNPPAIAWYADLYYETFSPWAEFQHGCHIIGHHSGGVLGSDLAAKHHDFVRSLTFVGPGVMDAAARQEMSKTFLAPFNRPVASGEHLTKTWDYLMWEGILATHLELLQREAIDHIRAWKGRSQIYSCVWAYDVGESIKKTSPSCKILALCARDDVLWPYFDAVKGLGREIITHEIRGGNFGPDLDPEGVLKYFVESML